MRNRRTHLPLRKLNLLKVERIRPKNYCKTKYPTDRLQEPAYSQVRKAALLVWEFLIFAGIRA